MLAARFTDRVGKGIRGAPRDALVADITPPALRGAAYGVRQALDTRRRVCGAAAGGAADGGVRRPRSGSCCGWAVLPAAISVLLVLVAVPEPRRRHRTAGAAGRSGAADLAGLGRGLLGGGRRSAPLFTLARFSEAFLVLRRQAAGLPLTLVPLVMV